MFVIKTASVGPQYQTTSAKKALACCMEGWGVM
jgi:hypothetical protein